MSNPFTTTRQFPHRATEPAPKPASDGSKRYMTDLALDKAAHEGQDLDSAMLNIRAWLIDRSQAEVSAQIDRLKSMGYTGRKYRGQKVEDTPAVELEDGFYELPGNRVVKVQHAVHGSGNQYAKLLNADNGKFEYTPSLITEVRVQGTRLTTERARELGQLYGMCVRCGATLTDEDSIAAGIGPVCAGKGF